MCILSFRNWKINTLSSKSIQTERAEEAVILTEQEETKTKYFAPYRTVWNIQMFNYFYVLTQGLDKIFYSKYDLIVWNLQMIRCLMFWPKTKTKFHSKPRKYHMFCMSSLNFEIDVLILVFVNCPVVFLRFICASELHCYWYRRQKKNRVTFNSNNLWCDQDHGLWVCSSSTIYKWEARHDGCSAIGICKNLGEGNKQF